MICVRRSSPKIFLNFLQFLDDDAAQHLLGAQNFEILGDLPLDVGEFVEDLLLLHAGQALQLQFDDGLRLPLGEIADRAHRRRRARVLGASPTDAHQRFARFLGVFAARISAITASRLSSAFWKPSSRCSRSRALRSR